MSHKRRCQLQMIFYRLRQIKRKKNFWRLLPNWIELPFAGERNVMLLPEAVDARLLILIHAHSSRPEIYCRFQWIFAIAERFLQLFYVLHCMQFCPILERAGPHKASHRVNEFNVSRQTWSETPSKHINQDEAITLTLFVTDDIKSSNEVSWAPFAGHVFELCKMYLASFHVVGSQMTM